MITDYLKNGTLLCHEVKNWKKELKKILSKFIAFSGGNI